MSVVEARLQRTLGALTAGVVAGTVSVSLAISYGTLIFRGHLESSVPTGVGLALFGGLIIGLIVAMTSGFRASVAGPQDAPAAIIGLVASTVGATVAAERAEDTVIAFVVVAGASTGVFLFALGFFRLGSLIRFLPYPVVGGFLGGTGVVLGQSTIDVVFAGDGLGTMLKTDVAARWIPAVAIGAALIVVFRRRWAPHIAMPALLVGGVVTFHVAIALLGISRDDALDRGWLLGPFPEGNLWTSDVLSSVGQADWAVVIEHATSVVAILLISAVSLLLHTAGLESELEVDVDVDRELRSTGAANLAASMGGGLPGYMYLADSMIVGRMVRPTRTAAVAAALVVGLALVIGADLVSLMPIAVSAGLLFFIAASLVIEWVYDARHRLAGADHLLVLLIVASISFLGFMPGLGVGIVVAIALFVVRYSRIDVVRHEVDAGRRRSNVDRNHVEQAVLDARGAEVAIFELQGFVFFGTADRILAAVRRRAESDPPLRDVLLDFRRVTGLDSSAAASFAKIARLGRASGFTLTLTGLDPRAARQLAPLVDELGLETAPDLDRGLETAEERIVSEQVGTLPSEDRSLASLAEVLGRDSALAGYLADLPSIDVPSGTKLLIRGQPSSGLYFLAEGRISVGIEEGSDDARARHRSMGPGSIVGEMGWYLDGQCTATVTTDGPCRMRHLDAKQLRSLGTSRPEVLSDLHLLVARTLAERLRHANGVVEYLLR